MLTDWKLALRLPRKRPAFAALVVALLGLGVGATTAVFSVMNAVILRPLPFRAPERLYQIQRRLPDGSTAGLTAAEMRAIEERASSVEAAAMLRNFYGPAFITGPEGAATLYAQLVTRRAFAIFGTPALLGRVFRDSDYEAAAPRTLVLSHRLWTNRYHRDPRILGRELTVNGESYTVIGVMPPDFQTTNRFPEMWAPWRLTAADLDNPTQRWLTLALVRPGQDQAALAAIPAILESVRSTSGTAESKGAPEVRPFHENVTGRAARTLFIIMGAVSLLLLIACLNVAVLLLARSSERAHELAVRAALGAGRLRLLGHAVSESVVLAAAGGALGVAVAWAANRALLAFLPARIPMPRLEHTSLDGAVLAFAAGLALLTGLACGLAGAWSATRVDLNDALKDSSRTATGLRGGRFRAASLVFQTALSLMLIAGAGLLLRSLANLLDNDPGFRPEGALAARIAMPPLIRERPRQVAHYGKLLDAVHSLPGVSAAGLVNALPLGGLTVNTYFAAEGQFTSRQDARRIRFHTVSPGYFRAIGIRLVAGRDFAATDVDGAPGVAIVNEALARRAWPGANPLGKRVTMSTEPANAAWLTVVGVVAGVRNDSLRADPDEEFYRAYQQFLGPAGGATLVLRTPLADPLALAAPLRRAIARELPGQPVENVQAMPDLVAQSVSEPRFSAYLLALFAAVALAVAAAGTFGAVSYSVSRRLREVAIRMALGATASVVLRHVAAPAAGLLALGVLLGAAGARALTYFLADHLYEVTPGDPLTYLGGAAILLAAALLACWLGARRAAAVDPAAALRAD